MERPAIGVENATRPDGEPDGALQAVFRHSDGRGRPHLRTEVGDLAQPDAAATLEDDVAAPRQPEVVQRRLDREGRPVHGGGKWEDAPFHLLAGAPLEGEAVGQCGGGGGEWIGHGCSLRV